MNPVHDYKLEVSPAAIDANGHANNVEFVRWMQEAAVHHADAAGCTSATREAGATWVVRSHSAQYLRPALVNDQIQVQTWVADFRRAFTTRRYQFIRPADGTVLAKGETNWIFVDAATGRPRTIPVEIVAMFDVPAQGWEPPAPAKPAI